MFVFKLQSGYFNETGFDYLQGYLEYIVKFNSCENLEVVGAFGQSLGL